MAARETYVESIRAKIGHDPIFLPCAGCAVVDDDGRVLLQKRGGEKGSWGLPGGVMELGESVHQAAVRETVEETGLVVEPYELLGVYTGPAHESPNGDIVHSVVVVLLARVRGGEVSVESDETEDVRWCVLDALPDPLFEPHRPMLDDLAAGRRATWT